MNSEEPSFTSFSPPPVNSNSTTAKTSSTTPHHLRSSQTSLINIVKAQISFRLSTLSADNYALNVAEINSLIDQHGQDTHFHLLRRLLIDSRICNTGARSSELLNQSLSYRLLIEKVIEAASDPALSAVFCEALNSVDSDSFKDLDLNSFLENVGINPAEKVGLCISLLSANRKEIVDQAREIIKQNIDPLFEALGDQPVQANLSDKLKQHLIAYFEAEKRNSLPAHSDTSKPVVPFPLPDSVNFSIKMGESSDQTRVTLLKIMHDAGYNCCSSASAFLNILNQLGVTSAESGEIIREDDVSQAIGMMARTHTEDGSAWNQGTDLQEHKQTWDIEIFVSTLVELQPHLDWTKVIEKLDYPEFSINDTKGLELILSSFKKAVKDRQQFPLHVLWGHWNNINGQFSFLRRIVQAPPEIFNINDYPVQKVLSMEDFATSNANLKSMSGMLTANPWNSVELIEAMIKMADTDLFEEVRQLFERAAKQTPEVMCLGLAQVQKPWNPLHQEIVNKLVLMFLTGHSSSTPVLTRLWQVNSSLFIEGCLEMYKKDAMTISRILDIAQDLKILNPLLAVQPFSFSIDLAALASRREYLNLEKWLQDNIIEFGDSFVHDCLEFLSQKIAMEVTRENNGSLQSVKLTGDVFAIFLRILSNSSMSPANSELFKEINNTSIHVYPRLLNPSSTDGNAPDQTFTADVEEEANSYYERVYRQEIGIEDFIKLLQRFKHSKDKRENQIFSCMVHNLFDEYQFFPKYPQRELTITSVIFGSLIQYQLVIYEALGIALRYVLNALRSPADSKMFNFGVQALLQFQSRLPEWPQYCSHLLQITQLQQAHPEIVQSVRSTLALNANKSGSTTLTATPAITSPTTISSSINNEQSTSKAANNSSSTDVNSNNKPASEQNNKITDRPAFTALNLDTLLAADKVDYEVPGEAIQDKILFIINNVAQSNLETKVAEMKDILKESHYRWFANYLVVKRASIEPNYHQLYLQFLESLESQSLCRHVLHETFANIKVLLNSEKTVQSSSERSLLKNLGSWLGGMTLAKNKPIKHKNIAFKELLIEGYDNNRLIVAIPFVCKVLEQASKSKVFKPPNPWLMAILKLLVELYQYADLKLNLKFEIEVLCKSLEIELKDIESTTIIKDRPPKELVTNQTDKLAQEFDKWPISKLPPQPSQVPVPSTPTSHSSLPLMDEPITNLGQFITINPNIPGVFANQGLRKLVHMAIDRAIREIITPVVERSVTIAGISTRELIIKDFAMEPNEEKMRNAAHLMVQNLAGSLALVTCKEPLRISMATHLRTLLLQNGFSEQSISEQAILVIVADNLDLACTFIEKAAMDKAVPEIDESLASSFSNRKKHRERTGQPYYDMSVYSGISRYMSTLPEPLRLKPNGLLPQQLRVYEDFSRIPRLSNQAAEIYNDRNVRSGMLRGQDFGIGHPYNPTEMPFDGPQVQMPITAHQSLEKFGQYLSELDKAISKSPHASWASMPPNHDIRLLVKEIPLLATQSFNRDETALHFSQKVVQLLYKNDSNLSREVYVTLLEKLCEISYKVNKEVTAWLIYADDERKFIVPVVVALIKAGLINANDQDTQLAKLIENGRPTVIDFTTKLIRECVLRDPPCAKRSDFVDSLDALTRLTQRGKASEAVIQLLEDLRPRVNREVLNKEVENMGLRDQLTYFFVEWVRVYQHSASNEKTYATFIIQLQQQGVLKGEEISSMFFRVCTEMSVDHYLKQKATIQATPVVAYQAIDAFSKLIVLLVKYHSDPEGINNNVAKINYLTKILSIIVLVLAQAHEQRRQQFNQKPFFRLFSSLLNDLNSYEQQLQPIYFQILTALSNNTFHTLQPLFFPGFTFAWLSLISHRLFMPKLLLAENQKGWPAFHKLLLCLFKFLVPFLRNVEMIDTTRLLYKGTLRVLLVLLHDFPEFLCDYHFSFCDVIPPSCIQLRNLILSAFPRNMRLPDPFTPNLKVDLLPEISQSPRVLSDYASALVANNLKNDIDNYLKSRSPISFPSDLKQKLMLDSNNQPEILSTGSKYNVPVINALVLYVGIQAISQLHNKSNQGSNTLTHSAPMDIFQQLLIDLDSEGRYLFLSAIANQLRYPNSHTHYFSCILLYLFAEGNQEVIKEQVTRVLLERLIVNRPHPWGLLITFIELIKNPRYNFWSHSFTRCAADIERLFDSVSRSINQV